MISFNNKTRPTFNWKLVSLHSYIWYGVILFAFFSPFIPLTGIQIKWHELPLMDWQRIFQIFIIITLLTLSLFSDQRPQHLRLDYALAWAALFGLGLLSSINAELIQPALMNWSWMLILVLAGMIMRNQDDSQTVKLDNSILLSVLISGLLYLWWFWYLNAFFYFFKQPIGSVNIITFPGFSNVRFFSDYHCVLLLLTPIAIERFIPRGIARLMSSFLVFALFSLALIAGSRSLIFAHILTHVSLLLLLRGAYTPYLLRQLKYWIGGITFFLVLTKLLPWILDNHANTVATNLARSDTSGRSELWILAWETIKHHPTLGVGPLHFANIPNTIASSPHNFEIQIAAEWGIPAAMLICGILIKLLFERVISLRASIEPIKINDLSVGITAACFAIVFESLVASSPITYPVGQTLALLCFAYPSTVSHHQTYKQVRTKSNQLYWLIVLPILVFILSVNTIQNIQERNKCFVFNPWPTNHFAPSFWQQGWIAGPCGTGISLATQLAWEWGYWKESRTKEHMLK